MANTEVTKLNMRMITAPYLGICVLLMILILCRLICKLKQQHQVSLSYASNFYKIVTVISIFSFAISSGIDFGDLVYYFLTGIDVIHTDYLWLIVLTNIFYGISAVTLYMIVFGKLYFTLKKAKMYQLHKFIVYYIVIMITVIALLLLFYAISLFFLYSRTDKVFFYHMIDVIFWIVAISDFTLTVSMLIMFVYQLSRIILSYSNIHNQFGDNYGDDNDDEKKSHKSSYYQGGYDKDDDSMSDDADNNEPAIGDNPYLMNLNLNQNQLALLEVVTIHSILCTFAIVSTQLFYASVLYASDTKDRDKQDLYFLAYSKIVKSTHGVINAFVLYLNFPFNKSLYLKWCNCCHSSCYNCFKRVLRHRISINYTELRMN